MMTWRPDNHRQCGSVRSAIPTDEGVPNREVASHQEGQAIEIIFEIDDELMTVGATTRDAIIDPDRDIFENLNGVHAPCDLLDSHL